MSASIGFDIFAKDRASSTFDKVGNSADRSGGKMRAFGKAGKIAALGLAGGVALAGVAAVKFAKGAMEDQQSAAMMAKQFKNSAGATKEQVAATEDWISKQGVAKGVADDDLRPALSKLVTATHDVGKAQKLAALAMDVSAGTGKDLGVVSTALMKAQNGQVSGLSKLGIATKDAKGHTISFRQATEQMATTFGGAASSKAETLQGKMDRLKLIMSETGEAIGYKMIPILTKVGTVLLNNVIPAIGRAGTWISTNLIPPLQRIGIWIGSHVLPMFQRFGTEGPSALERIRAKVAPFVAAFQQIAARVLPIIGSLARFITGNLVPAVVRVVSQVAGNLKPVFEQLVTTFRSRVLPAMLQVLAKFREWQPTIQRVIGFVVRIQFAALAFAAAVLGKVLPPVIRFAGFMIGTMVPAILRGITVLARIVVAVGNAGRSFINAIASVARFTAAVGEKVGAAVRVVAGIPGRIKGAIGNLGTLLYNAGTQVIQGLINGVTSRISALTSKLHEITSLIPKHKGPIQKDRQLLTPAGAAIMDGLIEGIRHREVALKTALGKVTARVQATGQKLSDLMSARSDFASSFQGFSSSVFTADYGEEGGSVSDMLKFQAAQLQKAQQLRSDVARLSAMGLSNSLVQQLASSGESGAAQIHTLAGGSKAQIGQLNSMNAGTTKALAGAGATAAGQLYDSDVRQAALADKIARSLAKELAKHADDGNVHIHLEGQTIVTSIKKYKREHGGKKLGLD